MARYAGQLLAPVEGFGHRARLFMPFLCTVVTLITLSSNLSSFEKNPKISQNIPESNKFKKKKNHNRFKTNPKSPENNPQIWKI